MRLAEFIEANTEQILSEWEVFARTLVPFGEVMDVATLRDHAEDILKAVALDLRSSQSEQERSDKSKGAAKTDPGTPPTAAESHGMVRAESGFTLGQMVSEYRALRASVVRLWQKVKGVQQDTDLEDLVRFNEAIDQALAESVTRYARDLDQSKDMFLAILGHDMRTPLGAMMMSATGLLMSQSLSSPLQAVASRILSSGTRIKGMLNDLLDFTRTRLGAGIPLTRADADLDEIGRQVVEEAAAYHPDRVLRFESTGDLHGSWDAARLSQALSNLVGNAVQHGFADSPVVVTARGETEEITFAVHNRGPVIAPNHRPLIFSPLKRIDPTARGMHDTGSMGLGLYIANEVVKGHGGRIDVESSEDDGTTFTVRLPRSPYK